MNKLHKLAMRLVISAFAATTAINAVAYSQVSKTAYLQGATWNYTLYKYDDPEQDYAYITKVSTDIEGDVVIPAYLDGCKVTSIRNNAFSNCNKMTSVKMPVTIKSCGENAFYPCSSLTAVHLADVEALKVWCQIEFSPITNTGCNPLCTAQNLYVNGELVTDLVVPDGVTHMGRGFDNYYKLTSVVLPDSCKQIDSAAFRTCTNLKSVDTGNGVEYIGTQAFIHCRALKDLSIGTGVVTISGGSSYGDGTFYNCTGLTDVVIPANVQTIGNAAFCSCNHLTNVTLCAGIKTIDRMAFNGSALTDIKIPDTVTKIGNSVFTGCGILKSAVFGKGITTIPRETFWYCSNLKRVEILGNVTSIGNNAFNKCSSLQTISLPNSVTDIGDSAFSGCGNLSRIVFSGNGPTVNNNAFSGVKADCTAYVPWGSIGWGVDIPGTWNGINIAYLFTENSEVAEEDLPETVAVQAGADVKVAVNHDMLVEQLNALVARFFAMSKESRQAANYFRVTGDYDAAKGIVTLRAVIDEEKIGLDETLEEVAGNEALSSFQSDGTMRLTNVKDGFYYGLAAAGRLEDIDDAVEAVKSDGLTQAVDGEVSLSAEKPAGGAAFFKVVVSDSER